MRENREYRVNLDDKYFKIYTSLAPRKPEKFPYLLTNGGEENRDQM